MQVHLDVAHLECDRLNLPGGRELTKEVAPGVIWLKQAQRVTGTIDLVR